MCFSPDGSIGSFPHARPWATSFLLASKGRLGSTGDLTYLEHSPNVIVSATPDPADASSCGEIITLSTAKSITVGFSGLCHVVPFWQEVVKEDFHGGFEIIGDLAAGLVKAADDIDRGTQAGAS